MTSHQTPRPAKFRSEGGPQRFYSMSSQIRTDRRGYYRILERSQAETTLEAALTKARFWRNVEAIPLDQRQRRVLNRLLDSFEGKLTTSKWAKLAKCSQDTALRDITASSITESWSAVPPGDAAPANRLERNRLE